MEYARRLLATGVGGQGRRVTLFHVKHNGGNGNGAQGLIEELTSQARQVLGLAGVGEDAVQVKIVPEQEGIAEDIAAEVKSGNYGTVVIGRRGISGARKLLFGSVSSKILNLVKDCAVCVV